MVVGSAAAFYMDGGASASHSKCRYKTGKCTNTRSSKRNGQLHQLCVYHRDKANKIQRKFDRHKRHVARLRKSGGGGSGASANGPASTMAGMPAASALSLVGALSPTSVAFTSSSSGAAAAPALSFATLSSNEVDIYSDSDSSRFSTDSESSRFSSDSDCSSTGALEQLWQDIPTSLIHELTGVHCVSPTPTLRAPSGSLSHDEIDFLCSAMLE